MNLKQSLFVIVGSTLVGAALLAQSAPPAPAATPTQKREARIEKRAEHQQKRIAQGVASGQLTPRETARLEHKEAKVNKDIAKAEADGKVTKKEATKIAKEQDQASRRIHRQKHDAQTRK